MVLRFSTTGVAISDLYVCTKQAAFLHTEQFQTWISNSLCWFTTSRTPTLHVEIFCEALLSSRAESILALCSPARSFALRLETVQKVALPGGSWIRWEDSVPSSQKFDWWRTGTWFSLQDVCTAHGSAPLFLCFQWQLFTGQNKNPSWNMDFQGSLVRVLLGIKVLIRE